MHMSECKEVSTLRPGYIPGAEAINRIAIIVAGPGIMMQEVGCTGFCFFSEIDGRLVLQQDMLSELQKLPFLQLNSIARKLLKKNEKVLTCNVLHKFVPEGSINRIESLLSHKGFVLTVKPLSLQSVRVSPIGKNKLDGLIVQCGGDY